MQCLFCFLCQCGSWCAIQCSLTSHECLPKIILVLLSTTGGTNHHPGNKRYRKMVEDRKLDYVNSKRLDKPLVALEIIREWRGQDPPGRFLKIDEKTGCWNDVGDKKAREKTSQALREKAPLIRKQQEDELKEGGDFDVRFADCYAGTAMERCGVTASLTRPL